MMYRIDKNWEIKYFKIWNKNMSMTENENHVNPKKIMIILF